MLFWIKKCMSPSFLAFTHIKHSFQGSLFKDSNSSGNNYRNWQVGTHGIQKPSALQRKQTTEWTGSERMGENLCQVHITQGRMLGPVTPDSTDHPTKDRVNEVRRQFLKGGTQMPNNLIKMLRPFRPQGNVNENCIKILYHSSERPSSKKLMTNEREHGKKKTSTHCPVFGN